MKKATLVARNVKPSFEHDCADCTFLGSLDGEDLYHCPKHGEYIRRFGDEGHQYGSLGNLCPEGSPYALAQALLARRNAISSGFARFKAPHAWKTAGTVTAPRREPVTRRQVASVFSN